MNFFWCRHCGNIVTFIRDSGVPLSCCGEVMQKLVPQTEETGGEKHKPVVTVDGNRVTVKIGSVPHPMENDHYIVCIALQSAEGISVKMLSPGMQPEAEFVLSSTDSVIQVYEYCNIHGLWV